MWSNRSNAPNTNAYRVTIRRSCRSCSVPNVKACSVCCVLPLVGQRRLRRMGGLLQGELRLPTRPGAIRGREHHVCGGSLMRPTGLTPPEVLEVIFWNEWGVGALLGCLRNYFLRLNMVVFWIRFHSGFYMGIEKWPCRLNQTPTCTKRYVHDIDEVAHFCFKSTRLTSFEMPFMPTHLAESKNVT